MSSNSSGTAMRAVMGRMVKQPIMTGRPMRLSRCLPSWPSPCRCHSMAVKKPLRRKKTGISKSVDCKEHQGIDARNLAGILFIRRARYEKDGSMEDNAQKHCRGAQGIQLVESGRRVGSCRRIRQLIDARSVGVFSS